MDHDVDAIEGAWGHVKDQNQNEVSIAWITISALLKVRGGLAKDQNQNQVGRVEFCQS